MLADYLIIKIISTQPRPFRHNKHSILNEGPSLKLNHFLPVFVVWRVKFHGKKFSVANPTCPVAKAANGVSHICIDMETPYF